jgi:hypothetical protein
VAAVTLALCAASLGLASPAGARDVVHRAALRHAVVAGTPLNFGDAPFAGGAPAALAAPVVGMARTPDGQGYWLVAADGGVLTYGDAGFFGSGATLALAAPVVGMARTPDGQGYWLVTADGGVLTYGDAGFFGSAGGLFLAAPVVGIAAAPGGQGTGR